MKARYKKPTAKEFRANAQDAVASRWKLFREMIQCGELPYEFKQGGPWSHEARAQARLSRLKTDLLNALTRQKAILALFESPASKEREKAERALDRTIVELQRTRRPGRNKYIRWGGDQTNYLKAKKATSASSSV
jgi:hypothetical protein